jgi:multidrug resistance efflux pump
VEVDAGDPVQTGQVLARLDDRHLQARVQRARSELDETVRAVEVERLAIAHERRRLEAEFTEASARAASSAARLEAAQSRAQNASREYERIAELFQSGTTSREEVSDAEFKARTTEALATAAEAGLEAARAAELAARLEQEGLSVREAGLAVLDAKVESARGALAVAQANLEAAVIRAPTDGWVVRRIVQPGASVEIGQPIISLWLGGELWIEAWVDEADLPQVQLGSAVSVNVHAFPDEPLSGRVETVVVLTDRELPREQTVDVQYARVRDSAMVCLRINLDQPPDDLMPGLSAVVGINKKAPGILPVWLARGKRLVVPGTTGAP